MPSERAIGKCATLRIIKNKELYEIRIEQYPAKMIEKKNFDFCAYRRKDVRTQVNIKVLCCMRFKQNKTFNTGKFTSCNKQSCACRNLSFWYPLSDVIAPSLTLFTENIN